MGFWLALLITNPLLASKPVWTYSAPFPVVASVFDGGTATVQYTVTNQSISSKNLILRATPGISSSPCFLEGKGSTCTLVLTINGSKVTAEGIHNGPILCEEGNSNQCYQPSSNNVLNVIKNSLPTETTLTVIPSSFSLTQGGTSQIVTSTNTGLIPAYGVGIINPPGLGISVSNSCASPLEPASICQLTFTSGSLTGTTTATIGGVNTNTVALTINVTSAAATTLNVTSLSSPAVIAINGAGVQLSIENTGNTTAFNVVSNNPPGVTASGTCGDIAPGPMNSCILTFNSNLPQNTNSITFNADNAPVAFSPPIAFSYQGFLIYATNPTSSTSGTAYVVNTADSGVFIDWDSSGCNTGSGTSTCLTTGATSLSDGQYANSLGNTYIIITTIGTENPPFPTNAAGLCYNINPLGNWYLPAICEVGGSNLIGSPCSTTSNNMYDNLYAKGFGNFDTTRYYWSSTEYNGGVVSSLCPNSGACAWATFFPNMTQTALLKGGQIRVRCARALVY